MENQTKKINRTLIITLIVSAVLIITANIIVTFFYTP